MTVSLGTDFYIEYDPGVNFISRLQFIISFVQNSRKIFKVHNSTDQNSGKKHLYKGVRSSYSSAKNTEKSIVEYGKMEDVICTDNQNNLVMLVLSV